MIRIVRRFADTKPDVLVSESTHLTNDLGLDSLEIVELLTECEEVFDLEMVDVEELPLTVQELLDAVLLKYAP